jgi:hypothetical protein
MLVDEWFKKLVTSKKTQDLLALVVQRSRQRITVTSQSQI